MYFDDNGVLRVTREDQCSKCQNLLENIACPLINALASGIVYFDEVILAKDCKLFIKKNKNIKLVQEEMDIDNVVKFTKKKEK